MAVIRSPVTSDGNTESPRAVDGLGDPDSGPDERSDRRRRPVVEDRDAASTQQVDAIVGQVDAERLTELAGAVGQLRDRDDRRRWRMISIPSSGVTARSSTA